MRQRDEALILGATVRDNLIDDVILFSRFVKGENGTASGSVGILVPISYHFSVQVSVLVPPIGYLFQAFLVALNFGNSPATLDLSAVSFKGILPANKQLSSAEVDCSSHSFSGWSL